MPESLPPHSISGDLKRSKTELLKAAAKLLGVLTLSLVPALATYLDAKAKAALALTAAASERATNDMAYAKLAERLNRLELDLRKLSVDTAVAKELALARPILPVFPQATTSTRSLERALEGLRAPAPRLAYERPQPSKEDVQTAQRAFESGH